MRRGRRRRPRPDRRGRQDRRCFGDTEAVRRTLRRGHRRARLSHRKPVAVAGSVVEGAGDRRAWAAARWRRRSRFWRSARAARRGSAAGAEPRARLHPDPHRRAGGRSVHASLPRAAHRRVRRLGRRQVVASGDARPRAAVRHGRHRAGRRARPGSSRIPRRHARRRPRRGCCGRLDRRRESDDAASRAEDRYGGRRIFPR